MTINVLRSPSVASRTLALLVDPQGNNEKSGGFRKLLGTLPEEALQRLVDVLFVEEIWRRLNSADCTRFERGLELLAPVPIENAGAVWDSCSRFLTLIIPPCARTVTND